MQKVVLVDDEMIILDGIASVIHWGALGTELIGTAQNGVEALDIIMSSQPDIVITDIRMPGMDGLELVAKVAGLFPATSFIMLTGFSEFDYAKTAMQYGVKHYLLKPCSEEDLNEALGEIVRERMDQKKREHFFSSVKYGLDRVLPYAKEQFLKELVTNKTYGIDEWQYFGNLFDLGFQSQRVRLLLIEVEGKHEYEHLFAIRNIACDIFYNPILSSTVGRNVLLLMEDELSEEELYSKIYTLRDTFTHYYHMDLTAALSSSGELTQVRHLYLQTIECLNHRFYLGEGSLITEGDIYVSGDGGSAPFQFDPDRLVMLIKAGNWENAESELRSMLQQLFDLRFDIAQSKSYLIQIFMEIIRLGGADEMKVYLDRLPDVIESSTLQSFQHFLMSVAREITLNRYDRNRSKQSQIMLQIRKTVHDRYADETLTLQTVANELYMNPDYIGKIFKKETGEKFTNYVMKYRMEKALERIERGEDLTVSVLAEATGFGDNSSYFSKMFKKYTGFAPSEYKKIPERR